eukprot:4512622-Amphidinium_carterae.1
MATHEFRILYEASQAYEQIKEKLTSLGVGFAHFNGKPLGATLVEALHRFDVFSEIFIPKAKLQHYFDAVKQNYRSVPFHNFRCAARTLSPASACDQQLVSKRGTHVHSQSVAIRHALATVHYAYKIAVGMNAQASNFQKTQPRSEVRHAWNASLSASTLKLILIVIHVTPSNTR